MKTGNSRLKAILGLGCMLLAAGCGQGGGEEFHENDIVQVNEIMAGVIEAINSNDEAAFRNLVASGGNPWGGIQGFLRGENSSYVSACLGEALVLERLQTGAHVQKLVVATCFDFSSYNDHLTRVFVLKWNFVRSNESGAWSLEGLRMKSGTSNYNILISDLKRLSEGPFAALGMAGGDAQGPLPMIATVFEALLARDQTTLHTTTVDGALFQALACGVKLPTVENSPGLGKYNREGAEQNWAGMGDNIENFSQTLNLSGSDLLLMFQTYGVARMPRNGTSVRLEFTFAGQGAPENVVEFTLGWTGVNLHGHWLIDEMAIERITHY